MDSLSQVLYDEAMVIINVIVEMGGMTKAIITGMPKMRIEEAAARRQAKLDSGAEVQVGVNKYKLENEVQNFEVLKIDNNVVREKQVARLNHIKETRDTKAV